MRYVGRHTADSVRDHSLDDEGQRADTRPPTRLHDVVTLALFGRKAIAEVEHEFAAEFGRAADDEMIVEIGCLADHIQRDDGRGAEGDAVGDSIVLGDI